MLSVMSDVGPAEDSNFAPIGQHRAGHQIDQHLRGVLIDAEDGDVIARLDGQLLDDAAAAARDSPC